MQRKAVIYSGYTQLGKTYGYLDFLNDPAMKDKKMIVIATDTIGNITENIELEEYKQFKDRIILREDKGEPVQVTRSVKFAEDTVKWAEQLIKKDDSIACVVVDNYDNLEEMYIDDYKTKKNIEKMMSYDYGIPRGKVYFNFIKPFLTNPQIHFFITCDVKEQYVDGNPSGLWDINLPLNRRKHFTTWIWIEKKNIKGKMVIDGTVKKWKGVRDEFSVGSDTEWTAVKKVADKEYAEARKSKRKGSK